MKLEVIVTRDLIIAGKRADYYDCPIAQAVSVNGLLHHVEVSAKGLKGYRTFDEKWYRGTLPKEARNFISELDEGAGRKRKLKPFIFEMNVYPI